MAAVKSRGNKTTEQKLLVLLRENKITGWRRHYKKLAGTPDFAFPKRKVAVFVDGCFWHGCECSSIPKTNRKFWKEKINGNIKRDKLVVSLLRKKGWFPIRIKEHEFKNNKIPTNLLNRLGVKYG